MSRQRTKPRPGRVAPRPTGIIAPDGTPARADANARLDEPVDPGILKRLAAGGGGGGASGIDSRTLVSQGARYKMAGPDAVTTGHVRTPGDATSMVAAMNEHERRQCLSMALAGMRIHGPDSMMAFMWMGKVFDAPVDLMRDVLEEVQQLEQGAALRFAASKLDAVVKERPQLTGAKPADFMDDDGILGTLGEKEPEDDSRVPDLGPGPGENLTAEELGIRESVFKQTGFDIACCEKCEGFADEVLKGIRVKGVGDHKADASPLDLDGPSPLEQANALAALKVDAAGGVEAVLADVPGRPKPGDLN